MFLYTKELVPPPAKLSRGLLRFPPRPRRTQHDKYNKLLSYSFAHSSVHGMHLVFNLGQRAWQRYFWLIIVIVASIGCFSMYSILAERHNEQYLVTVVETTQLPVYNIEFPAVAICPWNRVNWLRAGTAADRFLPANADADLRETFKLLLIGMEQLNFGNFGNLGQLSKRNLSGLSNLSMAKLSSYLAYRCDELFTSQSCVIDETPYECCKMFVPERTEMGQCLVFNSLISETARKAQITNANYPYKLSTAGEGSGLQFTLRLNNSFLREGTQVPFAMTLMVKEPRQWTQRISHHLYRNTENFVSILPKVIETSHNTYRMNPTKRRCYFDNEVNPYFQMPDLTYSRENCVAVCLQRSVIRICDCYLAQFLPPMDGSRECRVADFECLYRNTDIFAYIKLPGEEKHIRDKRRGHYCNCLANCHSRTYHLKLNVRRIKRETTVATSLITANIYYGQRVMPKYLTKLQYTHLDLLANFGGVLGLFVGASALSFFELAYVVIKLLWALLKKGARAALAFRYAMEDV